MPCIAADSATPGPAAPRSGGLVSVDGRTFPLKVAAIRARAGGGIADSRLVQVYGNPYEEPLEVLYTLPLPADGAVVGYTIAIGDTKIVGEIEKLEDARKAYRRALEEGRTAGLLEQDRADTFTQSLGSLPPGIEAEIEIRILHPVEFRAGRPKQWEYRFPSVPGVRYHGGRVEDRERLDVDRADGGGTPVRLGLELSLADGDAARIDPQSPSHEIVVEPDEGGCRLRFAGAPRLDRDVVVRWTAAAEQVGARLVEGPGLDGDDGRYGLLTVVPPQDPRTTFPRDLTVLIDASGSMSGAPLEWSKSLVLAMLGSLGPQDRFQVLSFANDVTDLTGGTVRGTPRKLRKACKLVEKLHAGGGTEMTRALTAALGPLRADSQRQVILLTDGYIGFEGEVVGEVVRGLAPGCRVHTVGVGSAPNRTLTRGVARAGRGREVFIDNDSALAAAREELLAATVAPVLTEVEVRGNACKSIAPSRPHDVLGGRPLVLAAELQPGGGTLELTGRLAGTCEPWTRTLQIAPRESVAADATALPLGALFGREAVADVELRRSASVPGEGQRFDAQIERLGLRHRIATRRTSLIAVADEPSVDPKQARRRRKLEAELPAGVSAEGLGLGARPSARARMTLYQSESVLDLDTGIYSIDPAAFLPALDMAPPSSAIAARVVRCDEDLLVIEFEVPRKRFRLPGPDDEATASCHGESYEVWIDPDAGTKPGHHKQGLTVRLAFAAPPEYPWEPGPVTLTVGSLSWSAIVPDEAA